MSEFGEGIQEVRLYDSLSPADKVRALIGKVREPVPREQILKFLETDLDSLGAEDQAAIETVFQTYDKDGLFMDPNIQAQMSDVDWKSVQEQIALSGLRKVPGFLRP